MKASHAVRESVRAVLRRPRLIALEIGWRWTLGLVSFLLIGGIASWFLRHTPVAQQDLHTLHGLNSNDDALQLAQLAVQDIFMQAGGRILRLTLLLAFGLGLLWTLFAGAGRTLTLRMITTRTVRFLPVGLAQALRAGITVGCAIFFMVWMWCSARISVPDPEAEPRWGLYFLLMVLNIIVTAVLWGIGNWVFWLSSITAAVHDRFTGPAPSALSSARRLSRAADHLDLEIAFGMLRTLLFAVIFIASLVPAGLLATSGGILPKILLVVLTLGYLAMADVLQIARVLAIVKLAEGRAESAVQT